MLLDKEGMLQDMRRKAATMPAKYRDTVDPPKWVGMDVPAVGLCFNTVEADKRSSQPAS
jgi:iron(III) transport system substrate-binding protein